MLHAKDLMIGDWIYMEHTEDGVAPYKELIQWEKEDFGFSETFIETHIYPVPLTPEILEKNGFVKSEYHAVWKIICDNYELRVTPWRFASLFLEDGADKEEYSTPCPSFVHELQHALRLCGIEKEIWL